jgi:uncharacterized membrane protein YdjX (TVP38/TMEM64 family)
VTPEQIFQWLGAGSELTFTTGIVVALAFVIASFVLIPRTLIALAAGALYGIATLPIGIVATAIGAIGAFLIARYSAAGYVQQLVGRSAMTAKIAHAVDTEGWKIVALVKLGAPIPAAVSNYIFGMTRIGLWPFSWATLVFSAPQTILFGCLGAAGRASLVQDSGSTGGKVLLVLGLLCTAGVVYLISKRTRASFNSISE